MTWRQTASIRVIRLARKVFANTPIQKLTLTTNIYRRVSQFGFGRHEASTTFRGVKLILPTKDATIVPGLVAGFYERVELDVFERLVAISTTVFDVGANVGVHCCVAANRVPQTGRIVAFEPVPENLGYLRRNIKQNERAARIEVVASAVGASDGDLEIHLVDNSIGTHSASSKNAKGSTTSVTVPMVSLDSYVLLHPGDPIDVLKVDVEGYEVSVLRGAQMVLREHKPTLFIEFIPNHLLNCGSSEREFLDIIFCSYEHVFVVDEPRRMLAPSTKQSLLDSARAYKNTNLIATAKPAHLTVIEAMVMGSH